MTRKTDKDTAPAQNEPETQTPPPNQTRWRLNLVLGVISFVAYIPIVIASGVAMLFWGSTAIVIFLLALLGIACCVLLRIFARQCPFRADALFLLPALVTSVLTFLAFCEGLDLPFPDVDMIVIPSLCSAGLALLLQIGMLFHIFINKK